MQLSGSFVRRGQNEVPKLYRKHKTFLSITVSSSEVDEVVTKYIYKAVKELNKNFFNLQSHLPQNNFPELHNIVHTNTHICEHLFSKINLKQN
jgi:hypothetical protein